MFPLTFGPTQHIFRCSFFLSSVRVILPPRHFSLPFFFSTSVPPHRFSPLISLGYWPCLSLLIQCSIGRSIERLSVKRGANPPSPSTPIFLSSIPHLPLPQPPHVSPDHCRHTSSWEAGSLHPILESISPPLSSPDHFSSPFTSNLGEVELHGAIMGFLKKTETGGFFWEPKQKTARENRISAQDTM